MANENNKSFEKISSIADFLKDPKGQNSSMRMAAIFVTFVITCVWVYSSVFEIDMGLADIPMSVFYVLAFLWGAKGIQRFIEMKEQINNS